MPLPSRRLIPLSHGKSQFSSLPRNYCLPESDSRRRRRSSLSSGARCSASQNRHSSRRQERKENAAGNGGGKGPGKRGAEGKPQGSRAAQWGPARPLTHARPPVPLRDARDNRIAHPAFPAHPSPQGTLLARATAASDLHLQAQCDPNRTSSGGGQGTATQPGKPGNQPPPSHSCDGEPRQRSPGRLLGAKKHPGPRRTYLGAHLSRWPSPPAPLHFPCKVSLIVTSQ